MAQFVMQDLVNKAGLADVLRVDSAATTNDEIGHPPHHGTVDKLKQVGVPVLPHRARKGLVGEDGKVLPDAQDARAIAQAGANAADVADPWFTGNFDDTYRDVLAGCKGLLTWCRAQ